MNLDVTQNNPDNEKVNEVKIENKSEIENDILIKIEEEKDMKKVPKDKLLFIMLSYFVMLTVSFLKGSEHTESIISVEMYIIIFYNKN